MRCFAAEYEAKPPVYIARNICSKVGILVPTKFVLIVPASESKEETETMYQTWKKERNKQNETVSDESLNNTKSG